MNKASNNGRTLSEPPAIGSTVPCCRRGQADKELSNVRSREKGKRVERGAGEETGKRDQKEREREQTRKEAEGQQPELTTHN